jgi:hypothetical protein
MARFLRRHRSMKRTRATLAIAGAALVVSGFAREVSRLSRSVREPVGGELVDEIRRRLPATTRADPGPILVLLGDPDCGACALATGDLERLGSATLGVDIVILSRGDASASAVFVALGARPIPTYLLFDAEHELKAVRSGYVTAWALVDWIAHAWTRAEAVPESS